MTVVRDMIAAFEVRQREIDERFRSYVGWDKDLRQFYPDDLVLITSVLAYLKKAVEKEAKYHERMRSVRVAKEYLDRVIDDIDKM